MKRFLALWLWSLISVPLVSYALSFSPDTIFLVADNKADCEAQGGNFTEWYEEVYCTKMPVNITFGDVPREHPHSEAIAYVEAKGIVSGYEDGTFRPEETINRVELTKILIESEYRETPACDLDFQYTDTQPEAWYQRYIQVASCLELVEGYPDGSFKPDQPVFITEASKMISGAFGFEASGAEAVWYEPYVRTLSLRGALPTSIETISSELTRGQMAEIIYRLESGKTGLASHTLSSLKAGVAVSAPTSDFLDVEEELDNLFNELDLENLLAE